MKKQQSGFTLIELVMVIVVLGILAAFALPRFVNLSGDARAATIEAVAASMRSASAMAHASYLAANDTTATTVKVEGGSTIDIVNGYPAATATGIVAALQLDADDLDATTTPGTVSSEGATTPGSCKVVYTAATKDTTTGVITPPAVNVTKTGC